MASKEKTKSTPATSAVNAQLKSILHHQKLLEDELRHSLRTTPGIKIVTLDIKEFLPVLKTKSKDRTTPHKMYVTDTVPAEAHAAATEIIKVPRGGALLRFKIIDSERDLVYIPIGISFTQLTNPEEKAEEASRPPSPLSGRVRFFEQEMYVTLYLDFVEDGKKYKFSVVYRDPWGELGIIDPIIEHENE